jgi:hypothetical protein
MASSRKGQFRTAWYGHLNTVQAHTQKKKEMVILKLDSEKAFDTIEHEAISQVHLHKGFGTK